MALLRAPWGAVFFIFSLMVVAGVGGPATIGFPALIETIN
jgi:hypothetical protein